MPGEPKIEADVDPPASAIWRMNCAGTTAVSSFISWFSSLFYGYQHANNDTLATP
jgi:hypothetical protein